jgi:subtilisin family serine protease
VKGLLELSHIHATGRGVRVAVIDSGVHAAHPHVQGVAGGAAIDAYGHESADYTDRLGHGTAVTAVIREKAPDAEILAIRVFDRELTTTADALVAAIHWAVRHQAHLINLSLGTANPEHEPLLLQAAAAARAAGISIVAAAPQAGTKWWPGAIPGVIAVTLDWTLPRHVCRLEMRDDGEIAVGASGYPRPIPGVPLERNLKGASFAVANAAGLMARVMATETTRGADYLAVAIAAALGGDNGTTPSS